MGIAIRPDTNSSICTTCCKQLLLDTYIETINSLWVERRDQIIILLVEGWSLKVYFNFNDLIWIGCKSQKIFTRGKCNIKRFVVHYILIKYFIVFFILWMHSQIITTFYTFVRSSHIWFWFEIYSYPSIFSRHNETWSLNISLRTSLVGRDRVIYPTNLIRYYCIDRVIWLFHVICLNWFVFSRMLKDQNVAQISANCNSTVRQPSMTSIVFWKRVIVFFSNSVVDKL